MFSSPSISVIVFAGFLAVAGVGMGFVSVPTLLPVRKSLTAVNLGVATSSQQFARTLGGSVDIVFAAALAAALVSLVLCLFLPSGLGGGMEPGRDRAGKR